MSGWGKELHKTDTRTNDIVQPDDPIWDQIHQPVNAGTADSKPKRKPRYRRQVFSLTPKEEENFNEMSSGHASARPSSNGNTDIFDATTALPQGEVLLAIPPFTEDHFDAIQHVIPRTDEHKKPRGSSNGFDGEIFSGPESVFNATIAGIQGFERVSLVADRLQQNQNGHENGHESSKQRESVRDLGRLINLQDGYAYEIIDEEGKDDMIRKMTRHIPGDQSVVEADVSNIVAYLTTQQRLEGIKQLIDRSVSVNVHDNSMNTVLNLLRISPGKVTELELLDPRHKDLRATFVLFDTIDKTSVVAIEGVYTHQQYDRKFRRRFKHPEVY